MNIKETALLLTATLAVNCSSFFNKKAPRKPNPYKNCKTLNTTKNPAILKALQNISRLPDGKKAVNISKKRNTLVCTYNTVKISLVAYSLRFNAIIMSPPPKRKAEHDLWTATFYHEILHSVQDHAAEKGFEKHNWPKGSISHQELMLYAEAAAYVGTTRLFLERQLQQGVSSPYNGLDHNLILRFQMEKAYNQLPESLSQKERLDIASIAAFALFVEDNSPIFNGLKDGYKKKDAKTILDIGDADPASKVDAFTTLPNGLNLYHGYQIWKQSAPATKTAMNKRHIPQLKAR